MKILGSLILVFSFAVPTAGYGKIVCVCVWGGVPWQEFHLCRTTQHTKM